MFSMRKSILYIFLSFLLAFAITDYVWIHLIQDDEIFVELQIEKEKEAEEDKLQEGETSKEETVHPIFEFAYSTFSSTGLNLSSGFLKQGSSYIPSSFKFKPGLYILYRQMKLDFSIILY